MSIWLAGLLAVLIVVGGLVAFVLVFASVTDLMEAMPNAIEKALDFLFGALAVVLVLLMLGAFWYLAFSWLMGWPL